MKIFCKTDINYKKQYHLFDRLDQKGTLINSKIFMIVPLLRNYHIKFKERVCISIFLLCNVSCSKNFTTRCPLR